SRLLADFAHRRPPAAQRAALTWIERRPATAPPNGGPGSFSPWHRRGLTPRCRPAERSTPRMSAGGLVAAAGSLQRLAAEQPDDGDDPHLGQLETNIPGLNCRRVRVSQGGKHA